MYFFFDIPRRYPGTPIDIAVLRSKTGCHMNCWWLMAWFEMQEYLVGAAPLPLEIPEPWRFRSLGNHRTKWGTFQQAMLDDTGGYSQIFHDYPIDIPCIFHDTPSFFTILVVKISKTPQSEAGRIWTVACQPGFRIFEGRNLQSEDGNPCDPFVSWSMGYSRDHPEETGCRNRASTWDNHGSSWITNVALWMGTY